RHNAWRPATTRSPWQPRPPRRVVARSPDRALVVARSPLVGHGLRTVPPLPTAGLPRTPAGRRASPRDRRDRYVHLLHPFGQIPGRRREPPMLRAAHQPLATRVVVE